MKIFSVLIFSLLASSAHAEDFSIDLGLWSHHWSTAPECGHENCNEANQLLAVEYGNFSIGTMENSFWRRSYLIGIHTDPRCWYTWLCGDLGITAATGYYDRGPAYFLSPRIILGQEKGPQIQILGVPGFIAGVGFRYSF